MKQRRLQKGSFGTMRSRIPALVLTEEVGWLTPIKPSASGYGFYVFRCRCGEKVIRVARDQRKNAARGQTPKCSPLCPWREEAAVAS